MLLAFIQLFYVDVTNILGCKSFVYAMHIFCVRGRRARSEKYGSYGWLLSCCHLKDRTLQIIIHRVSASIALQWNSVILNELV